MDGPFALTEAGIQGMVYEADSILKSRMCIFFFLIAHLNPFLLASMDSGSTLIPPLSSIYTFPQAMT